MFCVFCEETGVHRMHSNAIEMHIFERINRSASLNIADCAHLVAEGKKETHLVSWLWPGCSNLKEEVSRGAHSSWEFIVSNIVFSCKYETSLSCQSVL